MTAFAQHHARTPNYTTVWLTPLNLVQSLGTFDLDPCAADSDPTRCAKHGITKANDGLASHWFGRVWLNPPYDRSIGAWLERMAMHHNGVALVFARTDTKVIQRALGQADAVLFLPSRLKFVREDNSQKNNAGAPSMLLAYGPENVAAFSKIPGIFALTHVIW